MFPCLFLAFHMNLGKFLAVLFCAFAVREDICVIYKACCARTKAAREYPLYLREDLQVQRGLPT